MSEKKSVSLTTAFLSGEIHFGAWSFLSRLIGLLNTFLILSALTIYQYGVFQLLLALYAILSAGIYLGGSTVANDIARYVGAGEESKAKKLFIEYNIIRAMLAISLWAVFFFGSDVLLSPWYKPDFIAFFKILSFLFLSDALIAAQKTIIKARLNFKVIASRTVVQKGVQTAALAGFLVFGELAMNEVLISIIVASLVSALTLFSATWRATSVWKGLAAHKERLLAPALFTYGKWEIVKQLFSRLVSNIHPILIKFFISTEAVAFFNVAVQLADAFGAFVSSQTLSAIVPRALNDQRRARRVFYATLKSFFFIGILFTALTALLGPLLVLVLFPKYDPSIPYVIGLAFVIPFSVVNMILDTHLTAYRRQRFLFATSFMRGTITAVGLFLLLPVIGLWGAVAVRYITVGVVVFFSWRYLARRIPEAHLRFVELIRVTSEDKRQIATILKEVKTLMRSKLRSILKPLHRA